MENTQNTENDAPVVNNDSLEAKIEAALNLPDDEYIKILEEKVISLIEANNYGKRALETFVDLLQFIGDNFGHTSDYPIRVDLDFYEGLFAEKLSDCQAAVEEFFEKYEEESVGEDPSLDDKEVF